MFVPDWRSGNPYQELLAGALRERGCRVLFPADLGWKHHLLRMPLAAGFDILHIHWQHAYLVGASLPGSVLSSLGFLLSLLVLRLRGIRLVWTVHNLVSHERRFPRLERWANRVMARLVHRIVVHYPEAQEIVRREYRPPADRVMTVVPHGSFVGVYPPAETEEVALPFPRPGSPGGMVFLAFGAVRPYKRLEDLIEAFKGLDEEALRLLVTGGRPDPGYASMLQTLAGDDRRISFDFGFVEDYLVPEVFHHADVVVIPQTDALTSGSLVLAMSMGKPVVAAHTPHAAFLLGEQSQGRPLYRPESQVDLRRALSEMVGHRLELPGVGEANKRRIAGFTWADMADTLVDVYRG